MVITPSLAAYSDVVVLKSGDVGVLFETGEKSAYERIELVIVSKTKLY